MSEGATKGFWMSATLHGAAAALLFIFTFVVGSAETEPVKIFELVAGEGDNFTATEAPALGTPGGVKVDLPEPPAPRPAPPEPAPTPVTPAPPPPVPPPPVPKDVTPPKPVDPTAPNFKKQLVREVIKAESRAKRDIAKERAAEKKRLEAEKKRLEEEKKRMTKEEFDRLNKAKGSPTSSSKTAPVKVTKIDAEGIAKGVVGGSRNNKTGGAGGKALTATEGDELERYQSALLSRLKEALDRIPGLDDGLRAEAEFSITSNGMLVNARLTKSSRNEPFDRAVLEAISSVSMGYRPKGMAATLTVPFSTHARSRG
ncbi:MAG: TonB C-terminal domain-containing protein [Opitutaceae bacterium]|nr:TonB C-terminal domain-containing protein [Opitutaceae bacterium]